MSRSISTLAEVREDLSPKQLMTQGFGVVAFISTQMMHPIDGFWSRHDRSIDQGQGTGDIVSVSRSDEDRQRSTTLVNPDMAFGTRLSPIRGARTGQFASQRGGHRLAVDRLPFPLDPSLLMISTRHHPENLLPQTRFVPGLKTGMHTAAGSKPLLLQPFLLAAAPQNEQDAVEHLSIGQRRSAPTSPGFLLRKNLLDLFPKIVGNFPERGITHGTLL